MLLKPLQKWLIDNTDAATGDTEGYRNSHQTADNNVDIELPFFITTYYAIP